MRNVLILRSGSILILLYGLIGIKYRIITESKKKELVFRYETKRLTSLANVKLMIASVWVKSLTQWTKKEQTMFVLFKWIKCWYHWLKLWRFSIEFSLCGKCSSFFLLTKSFKNNHKHLFVLTTMGRCFFLNSWKTVFFFGQISSSFAKCLWKLVWKTLNTSEFNNNLRWIFICLNVELSVHLHMNQCSLRLLCDMIIERKKKKRFTGADDATWLQV